MQVRKERDSAVKACESAYEAGELLKEQLSFLMREKEIAEAQVSLFLWLILHKIQQSTFALFPCWGFVATHWHCLKRNKTKW